MPEYLRQLSNQHTRESCFLTGRLIIWQAQQRVIWHLTLFEILLRRWAFSDHSDGSPPFAPPSVYIFNSTTFAKYDSGLTSFTVTSLTIIRGERYPRSLGVIIWWRMTEGFSKINKFIDDTLFYVTYEWFALSQTFAHTHTYTCVYLPQIENTRVSLT